ncbi:MAG: glutamate 5-kinase [Pseudomonadota bacterium]
MSTRKNGLRGYRRIVIKVGSALLVDQSEGVRRRWLQALCADIVALRGTGADVIVVSSGSIALGRTVMKGTSLGHSSGRIKLEESQAAAAVGQIALAKAWSDALSAEGIIAGQVLLTLGDTEERRRYLNARATISQLLKTGAVPIINENDTVATNEIRYGDNDRLAARVATMSGADMLVLLSDIDGLYTAPPDSDPKAEFLHHVDAITPAIDAMAGDTGSDLSRGGMRTKIEAARIATKAGCAMIIASGKVDHPLKAVESGARHTLFAPSASPVTARKTWIAGQLEPAGRFFVDDGAQEALKSGKSLLPAGVRKVTGSFQRGDTVAICNPAGYEFARGLAAYGADEAILIAGRKSSEIAEILGYAGRSAMVHRDDMVLTGAQLAPNEDG